MQRLKSVLSAHEKALTDAWFERMLLAYPEASRKYFARVQKEFTNPVGANLYHSLEALCHELLKEEPNSDAVYDHLQMILRIKAVQEVDASKALSFVPAFKQIIQRECAAEIKDGVIQLPDLLAFFDELDTVTLFAFNLYMESRDLIYDMRLAQIKETNDILVRANLLDQELDMSQFMKCSSSVDAEGDCGGGCASCHGSSAQHDIDKGVL